MHLAFTAVRHAGRGRRRVPSRPAKRPALPPYAHGGGVEAVAHRVPALSSRVQPAVRLGFGLGLALTLSLALTLALTPTLGLTLALALTLTLTLTCSPAPA